MGVWNLLFLEISRDFSFLRARMMASLNNFGWNNQISSLLLSSHSRKWIWNNPQKIVRIHCFKKWPRRPPRRQAVHHRLAQAKIVLVRRKRLGALGARRPGSASPSSSVFCNIFTISNINSLNSSNFSWYSLTEFCYYNLLNSGTLSSLSISSKRAQTSVQRWSIRFQFFPSGRIGTSSQRCRWKVKATFRCSSIWVNWQYGYTYKISLLGMTHQRWENQFWVPERIPYFVEG